MKTSHFLLAAGISLALVFTFSCSSGGGDGGGVQGDLLNVNPQIYNKDGTVYKGSGVIDVTSHVGSGGLYGSGHEWDHIRAGSATNGIVNLNLPTNSPPDGYLKDFLEEFKDLDCPTYPNGIKSAGGFFVLADDNGKYIGTLNVRHMDEHIEEEIMYWYFSKAGKITCNFQNLNVVDINAKEGWNYIYSHYDSRTSKISTKNILTKEVKWIISDLE